MNRKQLKRLVKRYSLPTVAAVLVILGSACKPIPGVNPAPPASVAPAVAVPTDHDLANTIPAHCGCTNHASIIRIKGTNFGFPPGSVLRVDQLDRAFIGNHGGYEVLVEDA